MTRGRPIPPTSPPGRRGTTTTRAAPSRCGPRSPRTRPWSGPPSSTIRTSTTHCPSRSSTTPTYAWSTELRWILAAPLFGNANRLTVGLQYAGTQQIDVNFVNVLGNRGAKTKDQSQPGHQYRPLRRGAARPHAGLHRRCSAARGQYAYPRRARSLPRCGTAPATATAMTPTRWTSSRCRPRWASSGVRRRPCRSTATRATPTRRRCSLELTAPGQVRATSASSPPRSPGSSRWAPAARRASAWDGTSPSTTSSSGTRSRTSMSSPSPLPPSPSHGSRNIDRSRHTGVEAGGDVVLVEDIARRIGLGDAGDSLTARASLYLVAFRLRGRRELREQ